jgi:hypothetical protein
MAQIITVLTNFRQEDMSTYQMTMQAVWKGAPCCRFSGQSAQALLTKEKGRQVLILGGL